MGTSGIGAEGPLLDLMDMGGFNEAFDVRALFMEVKESCSSLSFEDGDLLSLRRNNPIICDGVIYRLYRLSSAQGGEADVGIDCRRELLVGVTKQG